jgi:hypothetical protein
MPAGPFPQALAAPAAGVIQQVTEQARWPVGLARGGEQGFCFAAREVFALSLAVEKLHITDAGTAHKSFSCGCCNAMR